MIRKAAKLELSEVIVCKDIQGNRNGTFSLLNVYPKDIAINAQTPANLLLSLWINFLAFLPEDVAIEVKISGKGVLAEDVVIPVNIAAQKEALDEIAVPVILRNIALKILNAGEICISYKTLKTKWKVIRAVDLKIA